MKLERALIIGKSGQVARALVQALRGTDLLLTSSKPGSLHLDLGNPDSIRRAFEEVDAHWPGKRVEVFLPGAMTHVDNCEKEKDQCEKLNLQGPMLVAHECKKRNFPLTFFSTEYVYGQAEYEGGKVGPFVESDPASAASWYGNCKLQAEKKLQEIFHDSPSQLLIVRTTMVFSWDLVGMNFFMQYIRHLEERSKGIEKSFRIPVDQISTPVYAPYLAEDCVKLREQEASGIIHLVGNDLLSRKELVFKVARKFGFSQELVEKSFTFVKTEALGQLARRPLTCGLRSERLREFGLQARSLEEAFTAIETIKNK